MSTAPADEASRKRRKYLELADELHQLTERPEFKDRKWNWDSIGVVLGISAPTAQRLVQWMRKHYLEQYWTVGIYQSDYLTVPTKQARVALDGMLNQQRHLITRINTMKQGAETLSRIDPDPAWKSLMQGQADHFASMLNLETDFQVLLVTRARALGWQPMERADG